MVELSKSTQKVDDSIEKSHAGAKGEIVAAPQTISCDGKKFVFDEFPGVLRGAGRGLRWRRRVG